MRAFGCFMWCAAAPILGPASACSEPEGPSVPEVSWSSEDFDFATDIPADEPLCGGTLDFQQRFVDLLQEIMGQPINGRKFTFYLFNLKTFEELLGDRDGLYNDGRVFTKGIPDLHEVTHAVADLAMGNSHPFFAEGIAEVFEDRYGADVSPGLSVETGLGYDGVNAKLPGSFYGTAGHFMSYALDVHGTEATVDLLARARPGDSAEVARGAIEAAFGMPYKDVLVDYDTYPRCSHDEFRWPIAECDFGARVEPVDGVWSIDADFDCTRADMLGTRVAEDWTIRTIDVPVAGSYRVTVPGDDDDYALVEIGHCSPGCAPDKGLEIEVRKSRTVILRQGRYQLTLVALGLKSGHMRVRIEPVDADPVPTIGDTGSSSPG
jgi:hypothetical protein